MWRLWHKRPVYLRGLGYLILTNDLFIKFVHSKLNMKKLVSIDSFANQVNNKLRPPAICEIYVMVVADIN